MFTTMQFILGCSLVLNIYLLLSTKVSPTKQVKPIQVKQGYKGSIGDKLLTICHNYYDEEATMSSTSESMELDSLDRIEFIMAVEEVFNIGIEDCDAKQFTDLKSVHDYLSTIYLIKG